MADPSRPLTCDAAADLAPGYVLGALEPRDAASVREHLRTCAQPHPDFEELGVVVPALLESVEVVEPPASLRSRILAAAAAEPQLAAPSRAVPAPRPGGTIVRGPATWFRRPAWIAAAVAAVIVVALGARTLQLQAEVTGLQAYRNGVLAVLDVAAQPGSQVAVLADPEGEGTAEGLAAIGPDGRMGLVMRDLEPTRGGEVYEAWLIAAEGAPVPVGSFRVAADGSATVELTPPAEPPVGVIVALTREPGPGATTPTLPIIALGSARPVAG